MPPYFIKTAKEEMNFVSTKSIEMKKPIYEKADLLRWIKLLLDAKIDVNEIDWNQRNALQYIQHYCRIHDPDVDEIIKLLIERGIRIELSGFNKLHFLAHKYSSRETLLNEVIKISLQK